MSTQLPANIDQLDAIAIVGMAGRFPGARNIDEYWTNLCEGKDSISFFSAEELIDVGHDPSQVADPSYVPARGMLDDADTFDAEFFAISPREAEIVDPQQRVFLECAWQALESAGYVPDLHPGPIAVFAGESFSEHFFYLLGHPQLIRFVGPLQASFGNEKDYLATRTSYKLNLRGPSVNVSNSCATSLVAVHLACQSLISRECDIALAGGVAITFPAKGGYLYEDGGIVSPDGRCRPFDAKAQGTVAGNGVGIVVLRRLEDALANRDNVLALIKGSAMNNDGALKVGYTAPSLEGQAAVICMAQAVAGVNPETITYVETHGTGTNIGDPIEVAALSRAFGRATEKKQFCGIGSVKSNIGHLDAAAGIAGLIKTTLALQHRMIPASLHYEQPNPQIDFRNSPFYVNTSLRPWPSSRHPRRAGVSSFGIGGTNVHMVLEEAPPTETQMETGKTEMLIVSARTKAALDRAATNLATYLRKAQPAALGGVAYTLAVGRKEFRHRMAIVCNSSEDAACLLSKQDPKWRVHGECDGGQPRLMMLFSGQGSQYLQMGRELFENEPAFRAEIDRSSDYLKPLLGVDLRDVIYAQGDSQAKAAELLSQTWITQPALFVVERALVKQWRSWGVKATSMLGHSLGELVAATEAGVMDEEAALRFVVARGQRMWRTEPGAMLSAQLCEQEACKYETAGISLAAVNGRQLVVFSGGETEIGMLENTLEEAAIGAHRLRVTRAFHSGKMDAIREEFLSAIRDIKLNRPTSRYISNVTGEWAGNEVTTPEYWWEQMRRPVRFSAGIDRALLEGEWIWLEVGPGTVLTQLVRSELFTRGVKQTVIASQGKENETSVGAKHMVRAAGELWANGVTLDWAEFYSRRQRRRVLLPTYPFEQKSYQLPVLSESAAHAHVPAKEVRIGVQAKVEASKPQPPRTELEVVGVSEGRTRREERLVGRLQSAWGGVLGVAGEEIGAEATFFELGVDSLLLIQISKLIRDEFQVRIPFRRLLEEFTTIVSLARYLDQQMPEEKDESVVAVVAVVAAEPASLEPRGGKGRGEEMGARGEGERNLAVPAVLTQQLQLMTQQLEMLRGLDWGTARSGQSVGREEKSRGEEAVAAARTGEAGGGKARPEPFVPYHPIRPHAGEGLTERQQRHLQDLIRGYNQRTAKSKAQVQRYRSCFADNRALQGFRLAWKELVYPIVGQRSEGAHIWDVDGNEYVDLTMGFGVHLFGHSPQFVVEAMKAQMEKGMALGPQSYLAGKVAQSISEMTGMPRVTFCNSGTEAVMAALRLARLASGRDKVAMFVGSYHGTFDGNLARLERGRDGQLRTVPAGPGTPASMTDDVMMLYYDEMESLERIQKHGHELAAVLVEPVQSRCPEVQPREFLHELRRVTEHSGTALIFDDMVTGFRIHPGGTQAWFEVRADMATYGKVVGGGMPIGVVAGQGRYLDGIDGGLWDYGDNSYPVADQIIFAGTFCKHPLTMAASDAVLTHLRDSGPELQQNLNARAGQFAAALNRLLENHEVPLRVTHCGSLLRFQPLGNPAHLELFFYHLLDQGVFVWEGRTAFLSTAHTEQDLQFVLRAVERTIAALQAGDFLPASVHEDASAIPTTPGRVVVTTR